MILNPLYHARVFVIRQLNKLPRRRALIKQIASQEYEQQRMIDVALHGFVPPYTPGAWWRIKRSVV